MLEGLSTDMASMNFNGCRHKCNSSSRNVSASKRIIGCGETKNKYFANVFKTAMSAFVKGEIYTVHMNLINHQLSMNFHYLQEYINLTLKISVNLSIFKD